MTEPVPSVQPAEKTESEGLILTPVQPPKPPLKCDPCPCTTLECGTRIVAIFTLLVDILVIVVYVASGIIDASNEKRNHYGDGGYEWGHGGYEVYKRSGSSGDIGSKGRHGRFGHRRYGSHEVEQRYIRATVELGEDSQVKFVYKLWVYVFHLLMAIGSTILATLLCLGAKQGSGRKLGCVYIYFFGTGILEFVGLILIIDEIFSGNFYRGDDYFRVADMIVWLLPELILLFINAYFLLVVYSFIKEVRSNVVQVQPWVPNQLNQVVRPLPYGPGVASQPVMQASLMTGM